MLLMASYFMLDLSSIKIDCHLFSNYLFSLRKETTIMAQTDVANQGQILQQGTLVRWTEDHIS